MFKPFSLFVGLRYSLTRRRNRFLSFVSLISMLGVSLGVMVLIVALSVINGSINSLRNEALKSVPHVTIAGESLESNWERQAINAQLSDQVLAAAPFLEGEAVLRYQGKNIFIRVRGVDPQREAEIVNNESQSFSSLLDILQERNNSIILGTQLASQLGISSANELSVTSLNSLLTRSLSDAQGFEVTGFADFGIYGNQAIALIN
ncbi:MAG: ABC transporter permease, partial [Pseudomonadota bacterium]|nr:ABC transporter permease [Pseudomonadota bacterium]